MKKITSLLLTIVLVSGLAKAQGIHPDSYESTVGKRLGKGQALYQ
jgi:hypothetical protein